MDIDSSAIYIYMWESHSLVDLFLVSIDFINKFLEYGQIIFMWYMALEFSITLQSEQCDWLRI